MALSKLKKFIFVTATLFVGFPTLVFAATPPLNAQQGGTGTSTYQAGDVLYATTTNPIRLKGLNIGSNGQCLTSNGSIPVWGSCGAGGSGSVGTSTNEVANQVAVFSTNSATPALIKGDANFTWDANALNISNLRSLNLFPGSAGSNGTYLFSPADGQLTISSYMGNGVAVLDLNTLTTSRTFVFPDQPGTLCIVGVLCDGSGGGGSSAYEVATTSNIAVSQVAYITQVSGRTTLGSVATGTVSGTNGITVTAGRSAVGGALAIDCTVATASVAGCVSAASFSKFNSASTTFSTGLTYSAGAVTCNTASATVFGCLTAASFSKFDSPTTTFSGGITYSNGVASLTAPVTIALGGSNSTGAIGASSTAVLSDGTKYVYYKLAPANFTTANISQWTNDSGYQTFAYPFPSNATNTPLTLASTTNAARFITGNWLATSTATSTDNGGIDAADFCITGQAICLKSKTNGTVTSVATNNGLTGGTITGAGTVGFDLSALPVNNLPLTYNGSRLTATGTKDNLTVQGITATSTASSTYAGGVDAARFCLTGTTTCLAAGGGSGTVSAGVAGQLGWYSSSGTTIVGSSSEQLTLGRFNATSTVASVFPYASSTSETISGTQYAGSIVVNTTGAPVSKVDVFSNVNSPTTLQTWGNTATNYYGYFSFDYSGPTVARLRTKSGGTGSSLVLGADDTDILTFLNPYAYIAANKFFGIGTTTPGFMLQVASATPSFVISDTDAGTNAKHGIITYQDGSWNIGTTSDANYYATSTVINFAVNGAGHIYASTSAPTLSSGQIDGTDAGGRVTSCSSACTITFAVPYLRTPSCIVQPETGSVVNTMSYTPSVTSLVVTETGLGTFNFSCRGQ